MRAYVLATIGIFLIVLGFVLSRNAHENRMEAPPKKAESFAKLLAAPIVVRQPAVQKDNSSISMSCESLMESALEFNLYQSIDEGILLSSDLIPISDYREIIEPIASLLSTNPCEKGPKSPAKAALNAASYYCKKAVSRELASMPLLEDEREEMHNKNSRETTHEGLCLHHFLDLRMAYSTERLKSFALKDVESVPLLLNGFLGELKSGNRDLERLGQILDRALALEPYQPTAQTFRTELAYLRAVQNPEHTDLREEARRRMDKIPAFGSEEQYSYNGYSIHLSLLERDFEKVESQIATFDRPDTQMEKYYRAWMSYVQGDVDGALQYLDRTIYREGDISDSFVMEAMTARRRIERLGAGAPDHEVFSPPLVMFGVAFLGPRSPDDGSRTVVGSHNFFLQDRGYLSNTPEGKEAFSEFFERPSKLTRDVIEE